MIKIQIPVAAAAMLLLGCRATVPTHSTRGEFSEVSPLLPGENAKLINTSHAGEGPAWHAASRSLYFPAAIASVGSTPME